ELISLALGAGLMRTIEIKALAVAITGCELQVDELDHADLARRGMFVGRNQFIDEGGEEHRFGKRQEEVLRLLARSHSAAVVRRENRHGGRQPCGGDFGKKCTSARIHGMESP